MGGPTSSYAAAIALEFIGAHKPLTQQQSAFDKVEIPFRGLRVNTLLKIPRFHHRWGSCITPFNKDPIDYKFITNLPHSFIHRRL
jgi:hypothetical protein